MMMIITTPPPPPSWIFFVWGHKILIDRRRRKIFEILWENFFFRIMLPLVTIIGNLPICSCWNLKGPYDSGNNQKLREIALQIFGYLKVLNLWNYWNTHRIRDSYKNWRYILSVIWKSSTLILSDEAVFFFCRRHKNFNGSRETC